MSEECQSQGPERRRNDSSGVAISSPDFNWAALSIARYLFRIGKEKPWLAVVAWPLGAVIVLSLITFITGLPSIAGLTIWADKKADADSAEHAHEIEKLKVTAEIEAARFAAEHGATGKLDRILQNTEQTDITVRAIGEDLQRLDDRVTQIEDAHRRPAR